MTNWDHYTPSAEYSGTWELYLGSSLYWGIFIFGLVVLIFAWRFKTKLKDNSIFFFPFASLLMLELFALFRALFVLVNIDWKLFGLAFFFYYTAPMACHFCAFSLFLLFLLGLIYYDPANQRIHRRVRILIHILMVASFITIIIMSAFSTEDNYTLLLYIISFILYAILSIIFLIVGRKLFILRSQLQKRKTIKHKKQKKALFEITFFLVVMMIYFLLFLVRSLWEILLVVGENPFFHKLTVWRNDQSKKYVVFLLVWFTIFEVIPTIFFICSFIFYINRVSSNIKREVGTPIKTENKFDNKLSLLFKYTNLSNMTFSSSDPDDSKDIKPENPNEIQNPVDDHLQQNNDIENIISSPSQKVSFHDNHELYESDSTQDENHPLIDQHENNFLPQNRSLLGNLKSQENLSFNQLKTKLNSETENENENDWY